MLNTICNREQNKQFNCKESILSTENSSKAKLNRIKIKLVNLIRYVDCTFIE